MPRPQKNSCDYFTHDNDMRNHRKVRALRNKFGIQGYAIWSMLLEYLTGIDGNRFEYKDMELELMSGDFGVSAIEIKEIIDFCTKLEMLIIQDGFVFSESLNERLAPVYLKRNKAKSLSQAQLRNEGKFYKNTAETEVSVTETPDNKNNFEVPEIETPQSKVNKSKVNKSKVNDNNSSSIHSSLEENFESKFSSTQIINYEKSGLPLEIEKIPPPIVAPAPPSKSLYGDGKLHQDCRQFNKDNPEMYSAEMFKEFLVYWTAPVLNGKKAHIGKELWRTKETFQLASRLATWFNNSQKQDFKNDQSKPNGGGTKSYGNSLPKGLGPTAVFPDDKDYR